MSALVIEHRPSSKTVGKLLAVIATAMESGNAFYAGHLSPSDIINILRSMDIDCELEDNVIKGTLDGQAWSFVVSNG